MSSLISFSLFAANPNITNIGFENQFTGWTGAIWTHYTSNGGVSTTPATVPLPYDPRITIMTDQTAYDICTGNQLKIIPSGYTYSARLGSYNNVTSPPRGWDQSLEYPLAVNATNEMLVIKFAVVFELPPHQPDQQPRFVISLNDNAGNLITNLCSSFDENASTLDNTNSATAPNGQPIVWRDWKTVSANLKAFEGQNITIKFTSYDCTPGGHFGYTYLVVDTQPLYITTKFCSGDTEATLTAPDGFQAYTWKYQGNVVGTANQCKVPNAKEGDSYTCVFTTAAGCNDSLSTVIKRINPVADFKFSTIDCSSTTNTVQFTDNSSTDTLHPGDTTSSLAYQWNFGDSITANTANPTHVFSTSGWQKVNLTVTNYPSTCTASRDTLVETFYPPLIGIKGDSTYCPSLTTTLKGFGADHYRWILANGSLTGIQDSLVVSAPGGKIGLTGYSSKEVCNTTRYLTVEEEPAWTVSVNGNCYFCHGDSTTLTATGDAVSYLWDPLHKAGASASIHTEGQYELVATNQRGCIKNTDITVDEIPLPSLAFTVTPTTINTKYNTVTCSINPESNITYTWNMGDGDDETDNFFTHSYLANGNIGKYTIVLHAVNTLYGCQNSDSASIIMEPFVPNVFTPNGDGYNERFMPGYDITIFDRNGIVVYEDSKSGEGWNGKYKGQDMDPDTYFYILHYTDYLNRTQTRKGYVTLVR